MNVIKAGIKGAGVVAVSLVVVASVVKIIGWGSDKAGVPQVGAGIRSLFSI